MGPRHGGGSDGFMFIWNAIDCDIFYVVLNHIKLIPKNLHVKHIHLNVIS